MVIATVSVRSRAAFACCLAFAALACSGDRKPAAPAAAAATDSTPVVPALAPAPAPAAAPEAAAPAPNLGLVPLPAQPVDTAADMLKRYELSMPKLQQWAKAQSALNDVTRKDPQLMPKMQAQPAPKTLDQMIGMLAAQPKIKSALKSRGTTPREYVLTMIAMQQAMQGYARVAEGKPLPNDLPPATAANVVWVQKNMPAIQQVLATIEK